MVEVNEKKEHGLTFWKNDRAALVLAFISLLMLVLLFVGLRQNLVGVQEEVVRLEQQRIVVLEEKLARLEQLLAMQVDQKNKAGKP